MESFISPTTWGEVRSILNTEFSPNYPGYFLYKGASDIDIWDLAYDSTASTITFKRTGIYVLVLSGGGGGGGSIFNSQCYIAASGGATGGISIYLFSNDTVNRSYPVTFGTGGYCDTATNTTYNGGTTSLGSLVSASGGMSAHDQIEPNFENTTALNLYLCGVSKWNTSSLTQSTASTFYIKSFESPGMAPYLQSTPSGRLLHTGVGGTSPLIRAINGTVLLRSSVLLPYTGQLSFATSKAPFGCGGCGSAVLNLNYPTAYGQKGGDGCMLIRRIGVL